MENGHIMANFPHHSTANNNNNNDDAATNSDNSDNNLVIDETAPAPIAAAAAAAAAAPSASNPYFNESIFSLSQKSSTGGAPPKKRKLREYAQYLGLQPTVQFKCSRCGLAGFHTLASLNDHRCPGSAAAAAAPADAVQPAPAAGPQTGFKLTRKVFLCSACGTYYENWNLYMHMLEYHRRHICLYCLGMFAGLDDLCQHIQQKHDLQIGSKDTPEDFHGAYSEPCYVACVECGKIFTESDNFFYHECAASAAKGAAPRAANNKPNNNKVAGKIGPEQHVTGDSVCCDSEKCEDNNGGAPEEDTAAMTVMEGGENGPPQEEPVETRKVPKLSLKLPKLGAYVPSHEDSDDDDEEEEEEEEEDDDGNMEVEEEDEDEEQQQQQQQQQVAEEVMNAKPDAVVEPDEEQEEEHPEAGGGEEQQPVQQEQQEEVDDSVVREDVDGECAGGAVVQPSAETPRELLVAGGDVAIVELELEQPLDKFDIRVLLQRCLGETVATCIYCNHARKIAVNGKQLGLHAIAEHRFSAVVNSITAEELIPESFVARIRDCLEELDRSYFSLESGIGEDAAVTFSHVFECFQCRYSTTVHKELYLHNRKLHAKNLLLCIMCKSNFYSYSELICHLCPGVYITDCDLRFRCCMCLPDGGGDLPSPFRLMVHLRKRHNACDVCLEMCHSQYRLGNHVWKHKLHHFCYRCGIAYRNKPDITRHLFWKHGTESVLCKRCLQKRWPHVYHFCTPPAQFACEECGLTVARAVALRVHRRLHGDERPHACAADGCAERFISKRLLARHEERHRRPEEPQVEEPEERKPEIKEEVVKVEDDGRAEEEAQEVPPPKPKVDVYDLPALNLSESDSSSESDEGEKPIRKEDLLRLEEDRTNAVLDDLLKQTLEVVEVPPVVVAAEVAAVEQPPPQVEPQVNENIWDDFRNYQANKDKMDQIFIESIRQEDGVVGEAAASSAKPSEEELAAEAAIITAARALMDHDYCIDLEQNPDASMVEVKPALTSTERVDHDYCSPGGAILEKPPPSSDSGGGAIVAKKEEEDEEMGGTLPSSHLVNNNNDDDDDDSTQNSPRKRRQSGSSDSSSGGGSSSSCSCGPNCSCSSSSGGGSSTSSDDSSESDSSSEEGRKRQQERRVKRRADRRRTKKSDGGTAAATAPVAVDVVEPQPKAAEQQQPLRGDGPIRESDLETTESDTDEEFYDRRPQDLAKKAMEEKRQQLLAEVGTAPPAPPNGGFMESTSRPPTPPPGVVVEEEPSEKAARKKSSKSKKRKKKRRAALALQLREQEQRRQQQQTVAPITLCISRPVVINATPESAAAAVVDPTSLRSSKRRRVPNKFYGYSSDEEEKKWRKTEVVVAVATPPPPPPPAALVVPPITIKTTPAMRKPAVEPLTISRSDAGDELRVTKPARRMPPIRLVQQQHQVENKDDDEEEEEEEDSATDSNDSEAEEEDEEVPPVVVAAPPPARPRIVAAAAAATATAAKVGGVQPQLYCYCRCPYDEVSEMIGCDSSDCAIEWFHFECVGIMVPPKGQWFCPDCRKRKQDRSSGLLQT